MQRSRTFLTQHPIVFGFFLIGLFLFLTTLTWPLAQLFTAPEGYELGTALSKLVMTSLILLLMGGPGGLTEAGFTSAGQARIWGITLVLTLIKIAMSGFAFTGRFWNALPAAGLAGYLLLFSFSTALLEETMYRGLLLTAMRKAWGQSRRGLFTAAFGSGLFFALLHLLNLAIRPFPVVAMQVVETVLSGFVYAAIVLAGRSIWPAVFFHWTLNAWVSLQISQIPDFRETTTAWATLVLVMLPVAAVGAYLLWRQAASSSLTLTLRDRVRLSL